MNDGVDPLFTGLCRPAMAWGVPYGLVIVNLMVNALAFIWSANFFFYLVVPVAFHLAGYLFCLRDPFRIEVIMTRAQRCPPVINRWSLWHCNSYAP